MKEFTHWLSIDAKPGYSGAAVYEFRVSVDEQPVPLGRALGIDTNGTLVIGSSGHLPTRQKQSLSGWLKASGSSTMNLLYYLERVTPFRTIYPLAVFEYRYAVAESVAQAKEWEERLLKRYFRQFGELPMLNSVLPNRYGSYDELGPG